MTSLRYYDILRVGEDPGNEVVRRSVKFMHVFSPK